MKDDKVTVVEVYSPELGVIEVINPERVRVGTRTIEELNHHDIPIRADYEHKISYNPRLPKDTLTVMYDWKRNG